MSNLEDKNKVQNNEAIQVQKPTFLDNEPGEDVKSTSSEAETVKSEEMKKTGRVIVSSKHSLIEIVTIQGNFKSQLITIDSENTLRIWDIQDNAVSVHYKLPVKSQVTAAAFNPISQEDLAIGTCSGESFIINLYQGTVLHTLQHANLEVTQLKFIDAKTEIMLVGACWGGKLIIWQKPNEKNNFTIGS